MSSSDECSGKKACEVTVRRAIGCRSSRVVSKPWNLAPAAEGCFSFEVYSPMECLNAKVCGAKGVQIEGSTGFYIFSCNKFASDGKCAFFQHNQASYTRNPQLAEARLQVFMDRHKPEGARYSMKLTDSCFIADTCHNAVVVVVGNRTRLQAVLSKYISTSQGTVMAIKLTDLGGLVSTAPPGMRRIKQRELLLTLPGTLHPSTGCTVVLCSQLELFASHLLSLIGPACSHLLVCVVVSKRCGQDVCTLQLTHGMRGLGETTVQCAARQLKTDTGITVSDTELRLVSQLTLPSQETSQLLVLQCVE